MNPTFVILVLIAAAILFFLLSPTFPAIGRFLRKVWEMAFGIKNQEESEEKKDE